MAMNDKAVTLGHPSYVWRAGQERRFQLIQQYAPLENARILDVGCGLGLYVRRFRQVSDQVYGVDVDPAKVRQASQTLPNIAEAPAEALPYADAFFDVVLLHEVLEHVNDDQAAVQEAYRVTAPGGSLVIFAPNRLYPFETHGIYWRGTYHFGNIPLVNYLPKPWRGRLCPHVRAYDGADLHRLLAGLPGKIVVHRRIFAGYDNIIARRPAAGRLLRKASYLLENTPLQILALSHLVIYRKTNPHPKEHASR